MNFVPATREARMLPSRYDSAIFRLVAYLRLRRTLRRSVSTTVPPGVLSIDRNQSATETYLKAGWMTLTASCFATAAFPPSVPLWLAFVLSVPLVLLLLEIPLYASGLVLRPLWNALTRQRGPVAIRFNSRVFILLQLGAAFWFVRQSDWTRFAAWQFLLVCGAEVLATVTLAPLRRSIRAAESAVGGSPSAA